MRDGEDGDVMMLKDQLDQQKDMQQYLFDKGFLITNSTDIACSEYPFYGNWYTTKVRNFIILHHKNAKLHLKETEQHSFFIIGHAFNPYTMEITEEEILTQMAKRYESADYQDYLDELTGVYILGVIENDKLEVQLDASGMQYGCYGTVDGKHYIASHMQLIGDLYGLRISDYVEKLTHYRWYHYMLGNYMPGNITCFEGIKRIIPNTSITLFGGVFHAYRFYPNKEIQMADNEENYREVIIEGSRILRNTMQIIPQKWKNPAISLTGGIDSNTTFAAANGEYDKYHTFSYVSMERETVDAEKAREISDRFSVPFQEHIIPERNEDVRDFDLFKAIFIHNDGEIGGAKDNETRKKIVLIEQNVCDVEVKSWISETIRAYAYKYFGRKNFPKDLSPRIYTSLYKIFLGNRKLARQTDQFFEQYFEETDFQTHLFNYDYTDFFVWEMMHGGKCGLNIGVMKSCFDITIPYNNRKFLDLMLRVPLDKRISDQHHLDMKKLLNRDLYDMNIRVVNLNETKMRKKAINLYYSINTHIPF